MEFLKDAVIVVFGCGAIGSGLVRNLVRYDVKKVIFTSRSAARIDKVYASIDDQDRGKVLGKTVVCEDLDGMEKLKEEVLAEFGVINGVVAATGSWREYESMETVLSVDFDLLQKFYAEGALAYAGIGKVFLPYLNKIPGSRFLILTDTFNDDIGQGFIAFNVLLPHLFAKLGVCAALRQANHNKPCTIIECRVGIHISYEGEEATYGIGAASTEFGEFLPLLMCMKPAHVVKIETRAKWLQMMQGYKETLGLL